MASAGIVKGSDNNFYPDKNVTRAEFTALLVRLLDYEEGEYTQVFVDVLNSDWFSGDVQTAYQHGLILGYGDEFRPNDQITREEIAVILSRVIAGEADISAFNGYADKDAVSQWAVDGMAKAIQSGIINGLDKATLAPQSFATRAMAITMLARMYNNVYSE